MFVGVSFWAALFVLFFKTLLSNSLCFWVVCLCGYGGIWVWCESLRTMLSRDLRRGARPRIATISAIASLCSYTRC
ncbi:hypothetical protein JR316_0010485 [Psilocybe cubensis]|uniref:Uncharacterized protein n=2 Tax=Psilocybe cubensis TaxID=181762 RepID=A0ACB8GLQ5_PSICU|nr:hypothetical protein JR316_0010485 [Psilocybe cubensis]KAH9476573.1 hypothetical protein JR316_0010485 [Psilocybe cubensis]